MAPSYKPGQRPGIRRPGETYQPIPTRFRYMDRLVVLTPMEARVWKVLHDNKGQWCAFRDIAHHAWDGHPPEAITVVYDNIYRLRKKLPGLIETCPEKGGGFGVPSDCSAVRRADEGGGI